MTISKDKNWWGIEQACRTLGSDLEEAELHDEWQMAANFIAETVQLSIDSRTNAKSKKINLVEHREDLRQFLETTSIIHQHVLDEWMRFHGNQGSEFRPHKSLRKNFNDQDSISYDYGKLRGVGLKDWSDFWRWHYSRPGARNPGTFRAPLKPRPKAPLVAVYRCLNDWWVSVLDQRFWPDYTEILGASDDDENGLPSLGAAALTFYLVAQEMNKDYRLLYCKRVQDDEYRYLKHKKAQ